MKIEFVSIPNQYSVTLKATEEFHSVECTFTNEFNIAQAIKCTVRNFYDAKAKKDIDRMLGH